MTTRASVRLRAGDAERETTAETLREAHAGRLDLSEFGERLDVAYAVLYLDELSSLTARAAGDPARTA